MKDSKVVKLVTSDVKRKSTRGSHISIDNATSKPLFRRKTA